MIAALPDAQAFSQRVAGLKRSSGTDCIASEDGKSCGEKPLLNIPTNTASTSSGARPASAIAAPATRSIRLSTSGSASLPKGEWAHPTID